jgi:hypothetical protein
MCLNMVSGKKAVLSLRFRRYRKDLVKVSPMFQDVSVWYGQLGPRGVVRILVPAL